MPGELGREELDEISAQPLLNYLLALSFVRGGVDFNDPNTNRNRIYEDLILAVYDRKRWAGAQHRALEGLDEQEFVRVLEEIALAVWHGDGRTATIREINSHCEGTGVARLLARFQKGAEAGVTRLLTAFYFRQVGQREEGDKTFEFTHKSFGEYLTVRRVLREADRMSRMLAAREDDPDEGWDEREALRHWCQVCGPSPIDEDLSRFLADESTNTAKDRLDRRHKTICRLIGYRLAHGMPLERVEPRPQSFKDEVSYCRNADEALLVARAWCAEALEEISRIEFERPSDFGEWLRCLQGQRTGGRNRPVMNLRSFDLAEQFLYNVDLYGADLRGSRLESAGLILAILTTANLERANLTRANLSGANLSMAYLRSANLAMANLKRANLTRTQLEEANLTRAHLERANLKGAHLKGANLEGAHLKGANLEGIRGVSPEERRRLNLASVSAASAGKGQRGRKPTGGTP